MSFLSELSQILLFFGVLFSFVPSRIIFRREQSLVVGKRLTAKVTHTCSTYAHTLCQQNSRPTEL